MIAVSKSPTLGGRIHALRSRKKPWGLIPLLIAPDVSKEMDEYLLKKGANVNAADREGTTVLMRAVYSRDPEIVSKVWGLQ